MKVLVTCEESQRVCTAFRKRGHEAYSCDIQECSGGHPEWHIQGDALRLINGRCSFFTADGAYHSVDGKWDLLIAHPPCTYLSAATTRHLSLKCNTPEKVIDRMWKVAESAVFFMQFALADCDRICVENPLGYMSRLYRKPNQIIHPYFFAGSKNDTENYQLKRTCLWLKNLPPLERTSYLSSPVCDHIKPNGKKVYFTEKNGSSKIRSKTFPAVARAMAEQWGQV